MMKSYFYTGSYTPKEDFAINLVSLDRETGMLKAEKSFSEIENPSYLAINKANSRLYALSETDGCGMITAYRIENDGNLVKINSVDVSGGQLCHIALNRDESAVAVAGYETGTVDLFRIDKDGAITDRIFSDIHSGKGAVKGRQDCPHCHFVFFPEHTKDTFYVTDLGNGTLYRYKTVNGTVCETSRLKIPAGDGPRHIIQSRIDNNIIYLICEISFKIHTIRMCDSYDEIIGTVSTIPDGANYFGGAGAIKISDDNRFLYVGNRVIQPEKDTAGNSYDSIVRFELGDDLLPINPAFFDIGNYGHRMPRDINLFGDIIVSAAQNSNRIMSCRIDTETGKIKDILDTLTLNKPVCILPCSVKGE